MVPFDAVVCFGGPLGYVLDQADRAVDELLRVLRPAGFLLISVMSLVGATAGRLPAVVEDMRQHGREAIDRVIRTGDLPTALSGHLAMHMYRWSELEALLERHGCSIVAASASALTFGSLHGELHASLSDSERADLIDWEIDLAAEPGAISAGEHIIAVARKASS
jgi:SAM-dependent methyltransferase